MNITQLFSEVLKNGGASVNPKTLASYTGSGYGVALNKESEVTLNMSQDASKMLNDFIKQVAIMRIAAMYNDCLIGLWIDNNKLYIDLSQVIHNREQALRAAKEREQLAIFDFATKQVISVK
jgi:hypothetical protein